MWKGKSAFYIALLKKWKPIDGNSLFRTKIWKHPVISQCDSQSRRVINSSIVSKDAMKGFKDTFPHARMFPLVAAVGQRCSVKKTSL